ncbi:MAG: ferrous iron transport protein B [Phycisphaerae bacterium]
MPSPTKSSDRDAHDQKAPPRITSLTIGGRARTVALVGNPNIGKTALFNALTGYRRHVANYPGVTVEVARGPIRGGGALQLELLDLPGTYSLAAISPDEQIVADALTGRLPKGEQPEIILAVADALNLRRTLYLVSQILDAGLPVVVAVNMIDLARRAGVKIDFEELQQRLGCAVVPVSARDPQTWRPLVVALEQAAFDRPLPKHSPDLAAFQPTLAEHFASIPRIEAIRILVDEGAEAEKRYLAKNGDAAMLADCREKLRSAGIELVPEETRARYAWIDGLLRDIITESAPEPLSLSERIDHWVTHPIVGVPLLFAIMFFVFQALFQWSSPLMDGVESAFGALSQLARSNLADGPLQSFIADGLIGGVGGVIVFLPQILLLFAFIAVLEDSGYLSRAAYMLDRSMRAVGLSGRSFIPLLSAFACAVPAILSTRSIADRRERFVTILLAPYMSCSARLPVYVLMIAAFVPAQTWLGGVLGLQGLVMFAMYLVGATVAIPVAWFLRRTAFRGPPPPFVLELPTYKLPRLRAVAHRVWRAGIEFLYRAGTLILLVNMLVWALGYFPRDPQLATTVAAQAAAHDWSEAQIEQEIDAAYLRQSYLGRMGNWVEPAVRPLGWDWRIGTAAIASFPAREVVISTLGTIFSLGGDTDESSESLRATLRETRRPDTGAPLFTLPVALSIMVFFALCAQCGSTLVVMGRELKSWWWPVFSFVSMTTIAYLAAWGTYVCARALL